MKIIVAAIVGGLVVFIWGAIAHMATPLGAMGISVLPDEARQLESFTAVPDLARNVNERRQRIAGDRSGSPPSRERRRGTPAGQPAWTPALH